MSVGGKGDGSAGFTHQVSLIGDFAHRSTDVSRGLFEAGLCLPSGSNLTPEQQARVIDALRLALALAERTGAAV